MTRTPARLRLRRRLLIYSAPLTAVAFLVIVKLISVVVAGNSAATSFARGDASAVQADAEVLGVANVVEPAKAPFAAGVAAVFDGRLDDADSHFSAALARTDPADACPVRVNLELVRESQGDRAAAAGDRARADERYRSALTVVDAAAPECFSGNNDSDPQRRAIRQDTANRLAAKLTAPPPGAPAPPPPPPPAAPPPPPPLAVITPDGREIPPRRLDPAGGDPLDKLQQVLQDAAGAAGP
ncbi:MAG: hypothetical protein VYA67_08530 [Actinomycetota bacterium]|uniref:Tetratricopeptide repeat protein n=1 Tax=Mycobacterium lentiflavum TaxID=141349 RepID=A0ABY3UMG0_MYCLN|nr:hypothetical protein [Mycobacterium lentiflavum]MEE3064003.1 hypothetical protein [Actinomycetota bacterium]ULP40786.1 hypothetical protein MJO58_17830 [Mycobacterium lentiflavum]